MHGFPSQLLTGLTVATVLSTIGSEFGKSNEIAWLGESFLLECLDSR